MSDNTTQCRLKYSLSARLADYWSVIPESVQREGLVLHCCAWAEVWKRNTTRPISADNFWNSPLLESPAQPFLHRVTQEANASFEVWIDTVGGSLAWSGLVSGDDQEAEGPAGGHLGTAGHGGQVHSKPQDHQRCEWTARIWHTVSFSADVIQSKQDVEWKTWSPTGDRCIASSSMGLLLNASFFPAVHVLSHQLAKWISAQRGDFHCLTFDLCISFHVFHLGIEERIAWVTTLFCFRLRRRKCFATWVTCMWSTVGFGRTTSTRFWSTPGKPRHFYPVPC